MKDRADKLNLVLAIIYVSVAGLIVLWGVIAFILDEQKHVLDDIAYTIFFTIVLLFLGIRGYVSVRKQVKRDKEYNG